MYYLQLCCLQVLLLQIESHEGGLDKYEKDFIKFLIQSAQKLSGEGGLFTEMVIYDLLFGYNDTLLLYLIKAINDLPPELPYVEKLKKLAKTINPFFGLEVSTLSKRNCVF